ncbi:MAG: ATP synthase F1 subunit delta [Elusimicrobia bacterium]|nr:ATP synthase F1 subunit delta [Elusimicrobiota bacterium]
MNLSERVLARRYAAAFVLAASAAEEGAETAVLELERAGGALRGEMSLFRHPRLSAGEKKALLAKAVGKSASRTALRFLEILVDKKRFGLLPLIVLDAGKVLDESKGLLRALARSAQPLTPQEAEALKARLSRFSGKLVELDAQVDESLLAGVSVRLGDWVLDGSLRGRLRRMGDYLTA